MLSKLPASIQTERVTVRPFENGDLGGFVSLMTDEAAMAYLAFDSECNPT